MKDKDGSSLVVNNNNVTSGKQFVYALNGGGGGDLPLTNSNEVQTPPPKPPPLPAQLKMPDKLKCTDCGNSRQPREMWWCRTCLKSLCMQCNLLKGHTEHRSSPWNVKELGQSLVHIGELRRAARTQRAADEEIAIKEYMTEVENYFLTKLARILHDRNESENRLIATLCHTLNFDPKSPLPSNPHHPSSLDPILPLNGIEENKLERVLREIDKVTRLDDLLGSTSGGHVIVSSPYTQRRMKSDIFFGGRSFGILPTMPPDEFARNLEEKLTDDNFRGIRDSSINLVLSSAAPLDVTCEASTSAIGQQKPASAYLIGPAQRSIGSAQNSQQSAATNHYRAISLPAPAADPPRVTLTVSDETEKLVDDDFPNYATEISSAPADHRRPFNFAEPEHFDSPDSAPDQQQPPFIDAERNTPTRIMTPGVQQKVGDKPQPRNSAAVNSSNFDARTNSNAEVRTTVQQKQQQQQPITATAATYSTAKNGTFQLQLSRPRSAMCTRNELQGSIVDNFKKSATTVVDRLSLPGDNLSTISLAPSERVNVTAFYFGDDFLTRPIDVCILSHDRLAVSDSCGGVYITTAREGELLWQIRVPEGSASSIRYCPISDELFISIMKKRGRYVYVYDGKTFDLRGNVECPDEPKIEQTRSRWISLTPKGDLYMVSGDNKFSAVWKLIRPQNEWTTLKVSKGTRYQYLSFIEEKPADHSLTFITCEGVHGSLLLFTVRQNKVVGEQTLDRIYSDLRTFIRSPASVCRDECGNLLILDFPTGKVWLLTPPRPDTPDRHLKVLMECGQQEGMGLAAGRGWCYVACLNKRRVRAVQYMEP